MSKISLKLLRQKKGITQVQMAEEVGITRQYLGLLESKKRFASKDVAVKISKMLKTPVKNLFIPKNEALRSYKAL